MWILKKKSKKIISSEPIFLVNQVRSELWQAVDPKYFQSTTWEKTVNDKTGFQSYRQFVHLMLTRLARSDEDLGHEAVALGMLIMNSENWRFYTTVKSLLPAFKDDYFANGQHSNLQVLHEYLKWRAFSRDMDIVEGLETKKFNTIKPIDNSLNQEQMRELCKLMFGVDDEKRMTDYQKKLMKSYIEYAYPKAVVEYTKATDLRDIDDPTTYGNYAGNLEMDGFTKVLPINCHLPPARQAMKDTSKKKILLASKKRQSLVEAHISDVDPSQDEPPPDLLIELSRTNSAPKVPQIQILEPTPEITRTQQPAQHPVQQLPTARAENRLRPPVRRFNSGGAKRKQALRGDARKKQHAVKIEVEDIQEESSSDTPFKIGKQAIPISAKAKAQRRVSLLTVSLKNQPGANNSTSALLVQEGQSESTARGEVKPLDETAMKSTENATTRPEASTEVIDIDRTQNDLVKHDPSFGGLDGAADCPSLIEDVSSSPSQIHLIEPNPGKPRQSSLTWKERRNFSYPSPTDSSPLTPQTTITVVSGSISKGADFPIILDKTLSTLSFKKENVKPQIQTPRMLLRAAEQAKFDKLLRNDDDVDGAEHAHASSTLTDNDVGNGRHQIQKSKPVKRQKTEEDWFMPEVKTPWMVSWTEEDAKAAEAAEAKRIAKEEERKQERKQERARKREERKILKETQLQIKNTRDKNELVDTVVVSNPYSPLRRMSPTSLQTISEILELDPAEDLQMLARFILKRSNSASIIESGKGDLTLSKADLNLIRSPYGLSLKDDILRAFDRLDIDFPRFSLPKDDPRPYKQLKHDILLPRLLASDLADEATKRRDSTVLFHPDSKGPWRALNLEPLLEVPEQDLDSTNAPYYLCRGRPGPGSAPPECQQIGFKPVPEAIEWFKGYVAEKKLEEIETKKMLVQWNREEWERQKMDAMMKEQQLAALKVAKQGDVGQAPPPEHGSILKRQLPMMNLNAVKNKEEYVRQMMMQKQMKVMKEREQEDRMRRMGPEERRRELMRQAYGDEYAEAGADGVKGKGDAPPPALPPRTVRFQPMGADRVQEMIARHEKGAGGGRVRRPSRLREEL